MYRISRRIMMFLYCICILLCINSVGTNLNPAYLPAAAQSLMDASDSASPTVERTNRISYTERFSTVCYSAAAERLSNELQRNAGRTRLVSTARLFGTRLFGFAALFSGHPLSFSRSFNTYNTAVLGQTLAGCKLDYRLMSSYFSDYI